MLEISLTADIMEYSETIGVTVFPEISVFDRANSSPLSAFSVIFIFFYLYAVSCT